MDTSSIQEQLLNLRRDHILDAAIEVIAENGFQRTTIKQIARRAGVADGTIYNYFDNKAAIMTAIVERIAAAERRDLDFANAAQLDFATFIETYIPQRLREVDDQFAAFKVVLSETMNNAAMRSEMNETIYKPLFTIAEAYIEHLMQQEQLEAGDPATTARLIALPVMGVLLLRLLGDDHVEQHWSMYSELVARLLVEQLGKD